jgi:hypothetical protein
MASTERSTIRTFTGRTIDVLNPDPNDIDIVDIAHALSMQCRFNGHIRKFYSVAEHSVRISLKCSLADRMWGLLHDAGEAYIGDMVSPLKHQPEMARFRAIEEKFTDAITTHFGLPPKEPIAVKLLDKRMFLTEARDLRLMTTPGNWYPECCPFDETIWPWSAQEAETSFLYRFEDMAKELDAAFNFGHNASVCSRSPNAKGFCG